MIIWVITNVYRPKVYVRCPIPKVCSHISLAIVLLPEFLICSSLWKYLSAHTKESAKALSDTVTLAFPEARLTVVVAMASDKDHLAFAKEILLGMLLLPSMLLKLPSAKEILLGLILFPSIMLNF